MSDRSPVGEVIRPDRYGRPMRLLCCDDGTRAKTDGRDFASVVAALSDRQVAYWNRKLARRPLYHERGIIRAELDRRRIGARPTD